MERFLWRFIAGHPFMPARFTAEGTEMRVVAFAAHKGGAGVTATAITLPAALARTGHHTIPIDLGPRADVSLPLVHLFCEFAKCVLRVRGCIPSTVHSRLNLIKAMLTLLPQTAPLICNTALVLEAPGTARTPSQHACRYPERGDYRLPAVDREASPSSAGFDALPQKAEPRPSTAGTFWSDA